MHTCGCGEKDGIFWGKILRCQKYGGIDYTDTVTKQINGLLHVAATQQEEVLRNLRILVLTRLLISCDAGDKFISSDCIKLQNVYFEDFQVRNFEQIMFQLVIMNVCT